MAISDTKRKIGILNKYIGRNKNTDQHESWLTNKRNTLILELSKAEQEEARFEALRIINKN